MRIKISSILFLSLIATSIFTINLHADDMIDICAYPLKRNGERVLPNNGYVDVHTNLQHTSDPLTKGMHSARTFITYELLKNILEIKKLWGLGILDLEELHEVKKNMTGWFSSLTWKKTFGRISDEEFHAQKLSKAIEEISKKVKDYYKIDDSVKNLYIDYKFLNNPNGSGVNRSFCPIYSIINQIESTPFDYSVAPDYKFYNAFESLLDTSVALSEIDYKINFFTKFLWDKDHGSNFDSIMEEKYEEAKKSGEVKLIEHVNDIAYSVEKYYSPSLKDFKKNYKDKYFAESGIADYVAILQATKDSVLLQKEELQYETDYFYETKDGKGVHRSRPFYQYLYDLLKSKKSFPSSTYNYDRSKLAVFEKDWKNKTVTVALTIPRYLDQEEMNEYDKLKEETSEDIFNFDHKVYEMVDIHHESLQEKRREYEKICNDKPHICQKALLVDVTGFRNRMRTKVYENTLGTFDTDTFEQSLETHNFNFSDIYMGLWNQWKIKFNHKGHKITTDKKEREVNEYFYNNKAYQKVVESDGTIDTDSYSAKAKAPSKFPIRYTVRDEFIQIFREISKERLIAQTHLLDSLSREDGKIGKVFKRSAALLIASNNSHFSWVHIVSLMLKDHFVLDVNGIKQNLDLNNMLWVKIKNFYSTYLIYPNGKPQSLFNWSHIKNEFRNYWNQYEKNIATVERNSSIFFWSTVGISIGASTALKNLVRNTYSRFKNVRASWKKKRSSRSTSWLAKTRLAISRKMAQFNPLLFKRNQMNVGIPLSKAPQKVLAQNRQKFKRFKWNTSEVAANLATIDYGWGAIGKWAYAESYAGFLHNINFGAANLGIANLKNASIAEQQKLSSARSMIWAVVLSGIPMRIIRATNKMVSTVKFYKRARRWKIAREAINRGQDPKRFMELYFLRKGSFLIKKARRTVRRYGASAHKKMRMYMPGYQGLCNISKSMQAALLDFSTIMKANKKIEEAFVKAYDDIFLMRKHEELAGNLVTAVNALKAGDKGFKSLSFGKLVRNTRNLFRSESGKAFIAKKESLSAFTGLMRKHYNSLVKNNFNNFSKLKTAEEKHNAFLQYIKHSTKDFADPAFQSLVIKHLSRKATQEILLDALIKMGNVNKYAGVQTRILNSRSFFIESAVLISAATPNAEAASEMIIESVLSLSADFIFSGSEMWNENLVHTLTNLFVGWVIVGYNTLNATASPAYNKMFDLAGKINIKNAIYQSEKIAGVVFASCLFASFGAEMWSHKDHIDENNPNFESWGDRFQRMLATSSVYAGFSMLTSHIRTAFITDVAARAKIYSNSTIGTFAKNADGSLIYKKGVFRRVGDVFGYSHHDVYQYASFISNWWGTYTAQWLLRVLNVQTESASTSGAFTLNTYHDYDNVVESKIKKFFAQNSTCREIQNKQGIDMETKLRECLKFAGENSEVARRIGKSWSDVFEKNFYEMHSFFKIDVKPRYNNPLPDVTFPEAPNEEAGESLTEDELEFITEFE